MVAKIVLFFDLGNTLGVPRLSSDGALAAIDVFPFVPQILEKLRANYRLGILSNTGTETPEKMKTVLHAAGIAQFFETSLELFSSVEGMDKSKIELFQLAVQRAGVAASRCVYISEDDAERKTASNAGMQVSFHPLHVFSVVEQMS